MSKIHLLRNTFLYVGNNVRQAESLTKYEDYLKYSNYRRFPVFVNSWGNLYTKSSYYLSSPALLVTNQDYTISKIL